MNAKMLLLVTLALALIVAGSAANVAEAGNPVVPFKASIQTFPEIMGLVDNCLDVDIPGEGHASHLGTLLFHADMETCFDWSQTGTMAFTAANGDQLVGRFEGIWSGDPVEGVTFEGRFWITGGTGRLEGVRARGAYWGTAAGGDGTLYFDGTLTK